MRLNRKQLVALAVGGSIMSAVGAFYLIKTKTSWFMGSPLYCKTFPTKDPVFPDGSVKVCVLSVPREYAPLNGDVELELTFQPNPNEVVIADADVWLADTINSLDRDYVGEINYSNLEIYDHGLLTWSKREYFSAWHDPLVPKDVLKPMWYWLKSLIPVFDRPQLTFEDKFRNWMDQFVELGAMSTTGVLTIWKVLKEMT